MIRLVLAVRVRPLVKLMVDNPEPFTFVKHGETIVTSYRAAPEEADEDPAEMAKWARAAYAAALQKQKAKPKSPQGPKSTRKPKSKA